MRNETDTPLNTIDEALDAFRAGQPVVVVDDEGRENEGDVIVAAQFATPAMINFMAREARGLICVPMTGAALDRLNLPMMVPPEDNETPFGCGFTVSVEARTGVTTGISAADRARTVQVLINPESTPKDLVRPGHTFPLRAHDGGILARQGHTEAALALTRLAGLMPAAVLCEVMNDDGTMARLPDLLAFSAHHDLPIITIHDLVEHVARKTGRAPLERIDTARMPTRHGTFDVTAYRDETGREHLLLSQGDLTAATPAEAPLIRLHSECLTGDVLGSLRCDCGDQLHLAFESIAEEGRGAVLYLRQEGRGIGLANKIRSYALQDQGLDTVEANVHLGFPPDLRSFAVAAAMLHDQGAQAIRLMTNNPRKVADLEANGITVSERIPHQVPAHEDNEHYLRTKARKLNHLLSTAML